MFKKKVLIIEDDDFVREVIKINLEKEGFPILEARTGEEALKTLLQGDNMINVSLILCDIRIRRMDCIEFIKNLKHHAFNIPVILLADYPDRQMADSLRKWGVKEYLVNTIQKQELIENIRKFAVLGPNSHN